MASTTIGGIRVDLQLASAAFIRDIAKTNAAVARSTASMQKSFNSVASTAKGAFAGLATIATVRQLASLSRAAIDSAAAIKDQAAIVGISAESLQAYTIEGERAGISADELTKSISVFVKEIGQARAATGPLVAGLQKTNLELLNQIQAANSTTEALDLMLDAIKKAPDEFEKQRLAAIAFGKAGKEMALLAAEGSAAARARLIELGLVLRNDVVEAADAAQDAMEDLERSISTGFTTGLIESFNGGLAATEERLIAVNRAAEMFGGALGDSIQDILSVFEKIESITKGGTLSSAVQSFFSMGGAQIREGSVLDFIRDIVGPLWDKFSKLMGFVPQQSINTGNTFPTNVDMSRPKPSPGIEPFVPPDPVVIKASTEAIHGNREAIDSWETSVTDALGRSLEFDDLQQEGKELFKSMQTPMEEYASSIKRLATLRDNDAISAETWARANQQASLTVANTALGAASAMSGALAGLFKENKAVAYANAVINTAEAITAALKNPPGPPFSYVYAAAAAVAGAAQIATIASTQPGTSKAIKAPSAGAATAPAKAGAAARGATRGAGTQQVVTVNVTGEFFGPAHFKKVLEGLNDVMSDGAVLKVNAR